MGVIGILLLVIFVIAAILMVIVVLMQDEQGEGLGGIFGGGSATPFGTRSGNVLTRFTTVLAVIFFLCAFGLAWVNRTPEKGDVAGAYMEEASGGESSVKWWQSEGGQKSEEKSKFEGEKLLSDPEEEEESSK